MNLDAVRLSSSGSSDAFVVRYDVFGNVQWAVSAGGGDFDESHGVTVGADGRVLVTGYYREKSHFGNTTLSGGGGFVASFATNGVLSWVSQIGNGSDDAGWGIVTDIHNNIYVAGGFSSWTFESTNLQTSGGYVEKLTSGGVSRWRQSAGNNSVKAITMDDRGHLSVGGGFFGSGTFGQLVVNGSGDLDAFVGRLCPDISLMVARTNNHVLLTWPAFPPGFRVQQSDGQIAVWNFVPTNQVNANSEGFGIAISPENVGTAFFRLARDTDGLQ